METPRGYTPAEKARLIVMALVAAGILLTLVALPAVLLPSFGQQGRVGAAAAATTRHVALDIMPVKAGGPAENWPAYVASTPMTVPANTVVTVTIRNFDLGDAALTTNSPLARVQGTVGGVASVDGKTYSALDPAKVAHTFTVPLLGLNVPIPGDAPANATYLTVTFSFRTHGAGSYLFQCLAPCGTGTGFGGPMQSMAYMRGTLTVAN
jgi:hypothetical protein